MSLKMMTNLLLCFMLLDLIYGQRDTFGYFVTLPATLHCATNDTLCVHMRSTDIEREVMVSMVTKAANMTLGTWKHRGEGRLRCSTFRVPATTGEAQEVATILVSITANGVHQIMERKYVLLKESDLRIFIQTDKTIYQPSQTVNCRIVQFNKDLIAQNKAFDLIDLTDSENNTIGQWRNMRPQNGIVDVSHDLPREPALGIYTFTVRGKKDTSVTFLVNEYTAIPRFDLVVNTPHSVPITQEYFNITVCGMYTYGKPVQGDVNGTICHRGTNETCKPLIGKTDASGCCTMRTDTESLRMKRSGFSLTIVVEISFTEDGTGVELRDSKQILIMNILDSVKFLDPNPTYRAAIPYKGKMLLTSANGSPMPNEDLCLYVDGVKQDDIYTTDQNGTARFTLDTTSWTNTHIELRGTLDRPQPVANTGKMQPIHQDGRTTVSRFYSAAKSQLWIRRDPSSVLCDANAQLWADFLLDPSESNGLTYIYLFALVVSRGRIIQNSEIKHDLTPNSGSKGFISVPLTFSSRLAPAPTLILFFVLPRGDLVADAAKFKISDNCFPNKVSVRFSEEQTLPGSKLNLNIRAAPGSLCSVRIVDKSILIHEPDTQNPKDQVNVFCSLLGEQGYPKEVQENQDCSTFNATEQVALPVSDQLPDKHVPPVMNVHEMDTFSMFQEAGLKVMSNQDLRKPLECLGRPHVLQNKALRSPAMAEHLPESDVAFIDSPIESKFPKPAPVIHQKFPEAWLFYLYAVG